MRLAFAVVAAVAALAAFAVVGGDDGAACDLVAAPHGSDSAPGTAAAPLRSPAALMSALRPGQTGCLRAGTYEPVQATGGYALRVTDRGRPGAPLVLRSFPGERAVLRGPVKLDVGSRFVELRELVMDVTRAGTAVGVLVVGDDAVLEGNEIFSGATRTCVELGSVADRIAHRPVLRENVLRDCGKPDDALEHAIYASRVRDGRIERNVIRSAGGYGVHLYPDADRTVVAGNLIAGSGHAGVIVASDQDPTGLRSEDNLVERNVVVGGRRHGVTAWWGRAGVGSGNVVRDNCFWGNRAGSFGATTGLAVEGNRHVDERGDCPARP